MLSMEILILSMVTGFAVTAIISLYIKMLPKLAPVIQAFLRNL
jgi:hypothetical protein